MVQTCQTMCASLLLWSVLCVLLSCCWCFTLSEPAVAHQDSADLTDKGTLTLEKRIVASDDPLERFFDEHDLDTMSKRDPRHRLSSSSSSSSSASKSINQFPREVDEKHCREVCQFCRIVLSTRWAALCYVQCHLGGREYDACSTVWMFREDFLKTDC